MRRIIDAWLVLIGRATATQKPIYEPVDDVGELEPFPPGL